MQKSHLFSNTLVSILFLFFSISLLAQKAEISGIVADSATLKPVEAAVVKVMDGKKIIVYGTTSASGSYKLAFEYPSSRITIVFQQMSYETKTVAISNTTQKINSFLKSKMVRLREVSVKAEAVVVKKDTISFNVGSFKTASDRSIEDVIKKLPGVKVGVDGTISYQGQDISKFNIEGLDMLGGKYNLATRNVQAKDVNRVEIKENYQEVKQLEGKEHSDKVAMNLKLKKEAKNKLLGNAELGGGYRENEGLYHGVLTGMIFGSKAQFIGTVKANNFGDPLAGDLIDHFGGYYQYNVADVMISDNLSSAPGLAYRQYRQKNDLMTSLNSIVKLSEFKTLRVNADYIRDQNKFRYETDFNYLVGANNIVLKEAQTPQFRNNTLRGSIKFQLNSSKSYVDNATSFIANTLDNSFGLTSNGNKIGQDKRSKLTGIQNQFSYIRRTGKRQLNLNSSVTYSTMPENRLTFTGVQGISTQFYQMGNGQTFSTSNGTSFGYDIGRMSKLSVGVSLRADYDKVFTLLQRNDTATRNRNDGFKITTSVSPEYRLLAVDERYGLTIGVPTSFYTINYRDRINPSANVWINRPYFSPWLNGHYILSPFSKLRLNAGLNTNIGDITDFIVNPIQASYNQQNTRSGILAITRSYSSNLGMEFKNPLKLFFANASVDYGNSERNILINQAITNGSSNVDINSSGIADKNNAQNISVSGDVSKDVRAISTFFSLGASYGISLSVQLRQGVKTNVYGNNFSVSPSIRSTVVKRLEMYYQMSYSQSWQHSVNFKTVYHSQSHNLSLHYNPIDAIVLYGSVNYNRFELSPKQFKNTQLFDAGIRYKYKKFETELKLNNLLNTRVYSYTLINQLDRYSYTYHLNPREIVAICKFTL